MMRVRRLLLAMALVTLVAAVPVASASAAASPPQPGRFTPMMGHGRRVTFTPVSPDLVRPRATNQTSTVWGGWMDLADSNVKLYDVASQFNVPSSTCPRSGAVAYFWVGLDGWTDGTVEQAGIAVQCNGTTPEYYDWYEMYPNKPVAEFVVSRGDTVVASVSYDSANSRYYLEVDDKTNPNANFNVNLPCPSGPCNRSSAEVVAEDPGGGAAKGYYLANFRNVDFSETQVISNNGTIGGLVGNSLWSANEITMEYPGSTVMVQPGARSGSDGNAFIDTYKSDG
jgi:hypothetical protein